MGNDQIELLLNRNVSTIVQRDELEKKLHHIRPLKAYLGVDPSSPEVHLGHAVVLWKLRQFQDLGHQIILLIGDFTAQLGDPSGRSIERVPLTHWQVLENARTYKDQVGKILRFDGENPATIQFNNKWLSKLTFKTVIDIASQFSVQQMIERDMFQERLKHYQSIGLHEFLYPLLVAYDSVKMDVDVEIGGNDQLFNMMAGRTLMEKMTGKRKVVMTCRLLTGSDGTKMSKSAGNAISISLAPDDMFGKLMAIDDRLIGEYARLCTDISDYELKMTEKRLASGENPRDVKMDVAERIVTRYSSEDQAASAREWFTITFSHRDRSKRDQQGDSFFPINKPAVTLSELVSLVLDQSMSRTRRLIEGGGVDVDGKTVADPRAAIDVKKSRVIKMGKHRFVRVQYTDNAQST